MLHELMYLAVVILIALAVLAVAVRLIGPLLRVVEQVLLFLSVIVILFVMCFVGAEVIMRYAFNSPIPGHLEGSELLVPVIVFFALSYTQATNGHVGMDLLIDNLSPEAQRYMNILTLLASIFVCAVVGWFSYKATYQLWEYDDVTMTPPYFKTWPAAAAIPLGYTLCAIRMMVQLLHLISPERYPSYEPELPDADHYMSAE